VNALTDTETALRTGIVQRPKEASAVAKAGSIWPALVVATGLLASLAWSGLLVWIGGQIIDIW